LEKFARKYHIHLIVAAHPTKIRRDKDGKYPVPSLYDISDSAHWANKPDVGIVINRADLSVNETTIKVAKARYQTIGSRARSRARGTLIRDATRSSTTEPSLMYRYAALITAALGLALLELLTVTGWVL
jgi:hypothetical protein